MKNLNKYRFVVTMQLLVCLVFYFRGCYSSYTTTIEPDQVPFDTEYEFINLKLKDSTRVDLKDKEAKYYDIYKETAKVVAVNDVDKNSYVFKKDGVRVHSTILKLYKLSEISRVEIEKQKFDSEKTGLVAVCVVVGTVILIGLIAVFAASGGMSGMHFSF